MGTVRPEEHHMSRAQAMLVLFAPIALLFFATLLLVRP